MTLRQELLRASAFSFLGASALAVLALRQNSLPLLLLAVFFLTIAYRSAKPVEPHTNSCLGSNSSVFKDRFVATIGELCVLGALWFFVVEFHAGPPSRTPFFFALAVSAQVCAWLAVWHRNPKWTMLEYSLWFSISVILLYYLNTRLAFLVVGAIFVFYWCFLATEIYRYSKGPPGLRVERNLFECRHVPNEDFWIQERAWLRTYFELGPVLAALFAAAIVLSSP
jgi:hypothetical protein